MLVTRTNVLVGASRVFARANFTSQRKLFVKFAGENGIDDGGLTKEFLRLLVKEISQSCLFEGSDEYKMLALDSESEWTCN